MTVTATSLAAYDELQPTLTIRQRRVLVALRRYREKQGEWPTGYELYEAMRADGLVHDLNDVRPRLTELRMAKQVENPTVKRHCRITKKRAFVWAPTRPEKLF